MDYSSTGSLIRLYCFDRVIFFAEKEPRKLNPLYLCNFRQFGIQPDSLLETSFFPRMCSMWLCGFLFCILVQILEK